MRDTVSNSASFNLRALGTPLFISSLFLLLLWLRLLGGEMWIAALALLGSSISTRPAMSISLEEAFNRFPKMWSGISWAAEEQSTSIRKLSDPFSLLLTVWINPVELFEEKSSLGTPLSCFKSTCLIAPIMLEICSRILLLKLMNPNHLRSC